MLSFFAFFVMIIAFLTFIEKQEQSRGQDLAGMLWLAFLGTLFYVFIKFFDYSLIVATLLSGALSLLAFYSFLVIEDRYAPRNILFRFILNFDSYIVDLLYKSIVIALHLVAYVVKPTIKIHEGLYNKRYQSLKTAVKKSQWHQVSEIINNSTPNQRAFLMASLSQETFKPNHYERWIKQEPLNALAYTLYGNAMIRSAWKVRGSFTADAVPEYRFKIFWKQLELAQEAFYKAIPLDNSDPEPFNSLIIVGRGLQLEQPVLWDYFAQLFKRDKDHYFGHQAMLTALTPKWGGSQREMFNFARKTVHKLPKGHVLYGLIPAVHIEQWLYYEMDENEEAHEQYFSLPTNMSEIIEAFEAFYSGLSQKPEETDYYVLNLFTFCFYQHRDIGKTRQLLNLIGNKATTYPWIYGEKPLLLRHVDTSYVYSQVCKEMGISIK